MDAWWLFVAGMVLIALAVFDMLWTVVVTARGPGPFTHALALGVWRLGTRHSADRHRRLELLGYGILVGTVLTWVLAIWLGLTLAFLSDPDAVREAGTNLPANWIERAGYAMGSLAGAGAAYIAGSGRWVLLNNSGGVFGLALVTLTLTYLFQVVTAASQKRALALRILSIADTPTGLAAVGLGRPQLGALGDHLVSLSEGVALLARYNLVLPVLHYLHVGQRSASIEVALAVLDDALTIVETAAPDECRGITPPVRRAIGEFLDNAPVPPDRAGPPPPPERAELSGSGLPDAQRLVDAFSAQKDRRARMRALVEQNGWLWDRDVAGAAG